MTCACVFLVCRILHRKRGHGIGGAVSEPLAAPSPLGDLAVAQRFHPPCRAKYYIVAAYSSFCVTRGTCGQHRGIFCVCGPVTAHSSPLLPASCAPVVVFGRRRPGSSTWPSASPDHGKYRGYITKSSPSPSPGGGIRGPRPRPRPRPVSHRSTAGYDRCRCRRWQCVSQQVFCVWSW